MSDQSDRLNNNLTKISVEYELDGAFKEETLWAKLTRGGNYVIYNTPWYARGIALQDVVTCTNRSDGFPLLKSVIRRRGNLALRLFVPKPERDVSKEEVFSRLQSVEGCYFEAYGPSSGLIAVSAPAKQKHKILEVVELLQQEGRAHWESLNF